MGIEVFRLLGSDTGRFFSVVVVFSLPTVVDVDWAVVPDQVLEVLVLLVDKADGERGGGFMDVFELEEEGVVDVDVLGFDEAETVREIDGVEVVDVINELEVVLLEATIMFLYILSTRGFGTAAVWKPYLCFLLASRF